MSDVAELEPVTARNRLTDRLKANGWITSTAVEAAFRAVPRHLFVPAGTGVQTAYADDIVATRWGPDGRSTSSVSAPWLQAFMVAAALLGRGMRVLEIGSGGFQSALIAHIVGLTGSVTTIDIDPVVVANTRRALDLAGYPQVEALCADGEYGHPGGGLFDAIIVSVETADIPPAWIAQLTPGGRLVVPVRMRGHTRCLTLTSDGDHLIAGDNPLQCGFVAMQGHGAIPVRRVPLHGDAIVLVLDDPSTQADEVALRAALERPRVEQWSPVTIDKARSAPLERLHLWLASQPGPYGILKVDREKAAGLVDPQDRFFDPVLLDQDGTSLAYLAVRDLDPARWELGAHAFGPNAAALTAALLELIGVWDRHLRDGPGPRITIHPAGTAISAASGLQLQIPRRHTQTVIAWPPTP